MNDDAVPQPSSSRLLVAAVLFFFYRMPAAPFSELREAKGNEG
jgi:hypothetical protein